MNLQLSPRERIGALALASAALIGLVAGWRLFWFLTDDAFIAFRYVGNSQLGYGYVWNPPPFLPVEGYTSFLWVLLLDGVWRVTGVEPPVAANNLSLAFAAINTLLTLLMLLYVADGKLRPWRLPLAALALVGVLSNRTFLAWTSSGLETALFNCLVTLWVFCVICLPAGSLRWSAGVCVAAALSALARPDGLLLTAASLVLVGVEALRGARTRRRLWPLAAAAAPLLLVPAHLLWRYHTYGAWLPNTYFAKSGTTINRLESGTRFLRSFVVEYALWVWLAVALAMALAVVAGLARGRAWPAPGPRHLIIAVVALTIVSHVLYYTYLIGGDHFEFRVYSHLIPLIFISFLWILGALRLRPAPVAALLALFIALSWPIPWLHWAESQSHTTRAETGLLRLSVADALQRRLPGAPGWLLAYLRAYDDDQAWLIGHAIGNRHQEHKIFYFAVLAANPPRSLVPPAGEGYPVVAGASVGMTAWASPRVSVIDILGLNDYVVARNPELRAAGMMAHERQPPPGYLACFAPALERLDTKISFVPAERIISCEARFRAQITAAASRAP